MSDYLPTRRIIQPDPQGPEAYRLRPGRPDLADQLITRPPLRIPAEPVQMLPSWDIGRVLRRRASRRARHMAWRISIVQAASRVRTWLPIPTRTAPGSFPSSRS